MMVRPPAAPTRHRPPRSATAHLETKVARLQGALRAVTNAPTLLEAVTRADEALSEAAL
jgi:hypothetical protein